MAASSGSGHAAEGPDACELATILSDVLTDEGKTIIVKYLRAISEADEDVAPEEAELLSRIEKELGLLTTI